MDSLQGKFGQRKLWKGLILASLGILALLSVTPAIVDRMHPLDRSRPILWSGYEGICVSQDGGATIQVYTLTDRRGNRLYSPVFAFWHGNLVYWSEQDGAVCVVSPSGKKRWVSAVNKAIASSWCHHMHESQQGVILTAGTPDTPVAPLEINLVTGGNKIMKGVIDARSSEYSPSIAILTKGGKIEFPYRGAEGAGKRTVHSGIVKGLWDYDPRNGFLCFLDGPRVTIFGPSGKSSWRIWRTGGVYAVTMQPDIRQIWISVDRPFDLGGYLMVYSYDGQYVGNRVKYEYSIGPPVQYVTPRIRRTLEHLAHNGMEKSVHEPR